jgi:hypothetical protein
MDDSVLVTAINTLLGLVPEAYRPAIEALMALLYALAGFLAVARPLLNRFVKNGQSRAWLDAFDWLLDKLALNTRPLAKRVAPPPKKGTHQ